MDTDINADIKFYNCCYTRLEGVGWKCVYVSDGIPGGALQQFLNHTSPIKYQDDGTETAREICSDGQYVYLYRYNTAGADELGRKGVFFVHCIILPWSEAEGEPGLIVSVSDENFIKNRGELDRIPERLALAPAPGLGEALSKARLETRSYITLIKTVFYAAGNGIPFSISYDGNGETLKSRVFAIYSALPYSLRKKVSFSDSRNPSLPAALITFVKSADADFIAEKDFSRTIGDRQYYFDQYRFITRMPENPDQERAARYFCEMDRLISEMGAEPDDMKAMQWADNIIAGDLNERVKKMSDTELKIELLSLLSLNIGRPSRLDGELAALLNELSDRSVSLNDNLTNSLTKRLAQPCSEKLSAAKARYASATLAMKSTETAARSLAELYTPQQFGLIKNELLKSDKGRAVLDRYYYDLLSAELFSLVPGESETRAAEIAVEAAALTPKPLYDTAIDRLSDALYGAYLKERATYDALSRAERWLCEIAGHKKAEAFYYLKINKYWDGVELRRVRPELKTEYKNMTARDIALNRELALNRDTAKKRETALALCDIMEELKAASFARDKKAFCEALAAVAAADIGEDEKRQAYAAVSDYNEALKSGWRYGGEMIALCGGFDSAKTFLAVAGALEQYQFSNEFKAVLHIYSKLADLPLSEGELGAAARFLGGAEYYFINRSFPDDAGIPKWHEHLIVMLGCAERGIASRYFNIIQYLYGGQYELFAKLLYETLNLTGYSEEFSRMCRNIIGTLPIIAEKDRDEHLGMWLLLSDISYNCECAAHNAYTEHSGPEPLSPYGYLTDNNIGAFRENFGELLSRGGGFTEEYFNGEGEVEYHLEEMERREKEVKGSIKGILKNNRKALLKYVERRGSFGGGAGAREKAKGFGALRKMISKTASAAPRFDERGDKGGHGEPKK